MSKAKSKIIFLISCAVLSFTAIAMGLLIKGSLRSVFSNTDTILNIFLGISPNFLYVFGFILASAAVLHLMSSEDWLEAKFIEIVIGLTIGAIIYEFAQLWMAERTFDILDIATSVIGAVAAWQLYKILQIKTMNLSNLLD